MGFVWLTRLTLKRCRLSRSLLTRRLGARLETYSAAWAASSGASSASPGSDLSGML
jgi:hypothetical protein